MKYFAYGMNTNTAQMALRCPGAVSLGASELPGYEFRFSHHADVIENPEFNTQGVLWEITDKCLDSLDRLEGYPTYYQRKMVTVYQDGKPVEAMVYYMMNCPYDALPSDGYLAMLYEGYREHGVSYRQIHESIDFINAYADLYKGTYYVEDGQYY